MISQISQIIVICGWSSVAGWAMAYITEHPYLLDHESARTWTFAFIAATAVVSVTLQILTDIIRIVRWMMPAPQAAPVAAEVEETAEEAEETEETAEEETEETAEEETEEIETAEETEEPEPEVQEAVTEEPEVQEPVAETRRRRSPNWGPWVNEKLPQGTFLTHTHARHTWIATFHSHNRIECGLIYRSPHAFAVAHLRSLGAPRHVNAWNAVKYADSGGVRGPLNRLR
jgi:hypothetical protein